MTVNLSTNPRFGATPFDLYWAGGSNRTVAAVASFLGYTDGGRAMRLTPAAGVSYIGHRTLAAEQIVRQADSYSLSIFVRTVAADPRTLTYMVGQADASGAAMVNVFPQPTLQPAGDGTVVRCCAIYTPVAAVAKFHVFTHWNADGDNSPMYEEGMMISPIPLGSTVHPPYMDGGTRGAEWLGEPHASESRYPAEPAEILVPGGEIFAARRAFPQAQALLAGTAVDRLPISVPCGWHGTEVSEESGSCCVARLGGPYEDLVGEVLRFSVGERSVYAYCLETADVPEDLSLTRRAFTALGGLYLEAVQTYVEVIR